VVSEVGAVYDKPAPFANDMKLGEALLVPTRLYIRSGLAAIRGGGLKGLAHITGGGITENLPRALPPGLDAEIDLGSWTPPAVFGWLGRSAGIAEREMLRTFNCGVGLVAIVAPERADDALAAFNANGETATKIGRLVAGDGESKAVYRGTLKL
jgi:phosphoribosylformylglycinamidine cyclo-ligase